MPELPILSRIADDPNLLDAVRAVFEYQFTQDSISTNMPNEILGQVVRANIEGRAKVLEALKEIGKYKTVVKETKPVTNPGR